MTVHHGSEQPDFETSNGLLSHELGSEGLSPAERASKTSSAEQANEWAELVSEQMDERVAQYLRLDL